MIEVALDDERWLIYDISVRFMVAVGAMQYSTRLLIYYLMGIVVEVRGCVKYEK